MEINLGVCDVSGPGVRVFEHGNGDQDGLGTCGCKDDSIESTAENILL